MQPQEPQKTIPEPEQRLQPEAEEKTPENRRALLLWAAVFSLISVLMMGMMTWMLEGSVHLQPFWQSPEELAAPLMTGIAAACIFRGCRWLIAQRGASRKKQADSSVKPDPLRGWWAAGVLMSLVMLPMSGFSDWQSPSAVVLFLVGQLMPALMENLVLSLLVFAGGLLPGLLYVLGQTLALAGFETDGQPFLILMRTLLPLVYLLVLNLDLSEEEEKPDQSEEKNEGSKKKSRRKFSAALNTVFVLAMAGVLLFGWGLLPWIPTAIATGSMVPALQVGDMAVVSKTQHTAQVGDIIQFSRDGISVVHRVIEAGEENGERIYRTKGDNNDAPDPGEVHESEIEGVVITKIPWAGWLTLWMHKGFS